MIANRKMEKISHDDLENLQMQGLKWSLVWAYNKSSFYQQKFSKAGFNIQDIASISTKKDFHKLPFTTYSEVQEHNPYDFQTLPMSVIERVSLWEHPSPIIKMYTKEDVLQNVEMMFRVMVSAGVTKGETVGILGELADSGLMDAHTALKDMGVTVVHLSTEYIRAIRLLEVSHPSILLGSSRRILQLLVQLQAVHKSIEDFPIKKIFCLVESVQNPLRFHVARRTKTKVYDLFSSAEFGCAAMMYPCEDGAAQHLQEDFFYGEVIDFSTGEVITEEMRMGELTLTTLRAEAMPLIRCRTGQTVMRLDSKCPCGRTFARFITPAGRFVK